MFIKNENHRVEPTRFDFTIRVDLYACSNG
jgi:hypothetical protein